MNLAPCWHALDEVGSARDGVTSSPKGRPPGGPILTKDPDFAAEPFRLQALLLLKIFDQQKIVSHSEYFHPNQII